jgi:hypothetical protein
MELSMKLRYSLLSLIIALALILSACSSAAPTTPAAPSEPAEPAKVEAKWNYDYITQVPPIMMRDALIEMLGQTNEPIPYYYEEAVKVAGHSCMVAASAWMMTKLALEELYPDGEVPVRGQIAIQMPGAENEWNIGVYGEVMTFITGAAPATGFSGSVFAKGNPLTIRRDKMTYTEETIGTPPPQMQYIFTRIDTGKSVAVSWNIAKVIPAINEKVLAEPGHALASGSATPEQVAEFNKNWNDAALYILQNAGVVEGLVTVTPVE